LNNSGPTASQLHNYEHLIESLIQSGFGSINQFFSADLTSRLRDKLLSHYADGHMHKAGIGKKHDIVIRQDIRGDVILWMNNDSVDLDEIEFLASVNQFISYLNRTCFAGIVEFECHYALYDVGSFYKRHLDQFQRDDKRVYSFVTYLNIDWQAKDLGQLIAYFPNAEKRTIFPYGGSIACFKADEIEHEVNASTRPRLSIAGWFKRQ